MKRKTSVSATYIENNLTQDILNIAEVMLVAIDPDFRVALINKKGCEILGYKRHEIIGKNWFDNFLPKNIRNEVKRIFHQVLSDKRKLGEHYENSVLTKSGEERIISWHNAMLRNKKGQIIATLSSGKDITARKNTEKLLDIQHDLALTLGAVSKLEDGLDACLEASFKASGMDCGGIYFIDENSDSLNLVYHKGLSADFVKSVSRYNAKSANLRLVKGGKAIYVKFDDLEIPRSKAEERENLQAFAVIPIHYQNQIIGCVNVSSHTSNEIPIFARHALEAISAEIGSAIVRLKSEDKIKQLAVRDSQTGCYNHHYYNDVIKSEFGRATKKGQPLSIIMLDVDYFKSINDAYGHQFGDMILQQLVFQINKIVRAYDIIIRFGGEEFIILSPSTSRDEAIHIAQRILNHVNLYKFGDAKRVVKLKLSMAVASYPDDLIVKVDDFIELADKILDISKKRGGNRVSDSSMLKKGDPRHVPVVGESENVKYLKTKIERLTKRTNQTMMESIFAFAKTIELKDQYTGSHVERTVSYAVNIAEAMGLSKADIDCVRKAAILHDLGKLGISETILRKKAKLTKKEFEIIKTHPRIGVDILRPIHLLRDVIPFILYHHEWWDGRGYPCGLKGNSIPLGARIVSIADAYQALTSNRPYRKAYSKKESIEIIEKESGIKFDPKVVDVFVKILKK